VGVGAAYNHPFTVADGAAAERDTELGAGSLNLTLDANGTWINQTVAATDPNVDYNESGTTIRYTIKNPATGSWVACITNVSAQTSFDLEIEFIRKHPATGKCFANPYESCHISGYRYGTDDGDEYLVLRNDGEDVAIGRLPVNFTERERRM
jgi:hypothetical protein